MSKTRLRHDEPANKLPFVIAVETRDGRPIYTQLRVVSGFSNEAIRDYAIANIAAGARVLSDGLACWNGFDEAGLKHISKITGSGRPTDIKFKWVNTGLGNTKGSITGTCRSIETTMLFCILLLTTFPIRVFRRVVRFVTVSLMRFSRLSISGS